MVQIFEWSLDNTHFIPYNLLQLHQESDLNCLKNVREQIETNRNWIPAENIFLSVTFANIMKNEDLSTYDLVIML